MALMEITDLAFSYSDKELFNNASMKLNEGEHACLVGNNGVGKTTLMKLIIGELHPDQGKVSWTSGVSYSYLDQGLTVKEDVVALEYLYGVYEPLYRKEKEMLRLYEESASSTDNYEKLLNKALRIQDELEQNGFYALEEKIGRLTDGLGFQKEQLMRPLNTLSSGQREKVFLAKMLLEEKDILLMDEPTNFLDQGQVENLIEFLVDYPKAFLVISHDEAFLKKIANVVFVLENRTITRYKGDYAHYLSQHELDKEQYEKNYLAQQRYIKREEDFIAKHIVRATSSKAAKSRRARLAHLEVLPPPASDNNKVFFSFPFSGNVGNKVLEVTDLEIGYDYPLLSPISFTLHKGEKIAILGENGVGKSTLIKTLLGTIPALGGSFKWLDGTDINYFAQEEKIDRSLSPFAFIHQEFPLLDNTTIRKVLGNSGITKEKALRPFNELSGGEVSKARLSAMTLKKKNFLIFDELTNHLDQKAKEALYNAMARFSGCLILISHEKDFYEGLLNYELVLD